MILYMLTRFEVGPAPAILGTHPDLESARRGAIAQTVEAHEETSPEVAKLASDGPNWQEYRLASGDAEAVILGLPADKARTTGSVLAAFRICCVDLPEEPSGEAMGCG